MLRRMAAHLIAGALALAGACSGAPPAFAQTAGEAASGEILCHADADRVLVCVNEAERAAPGAKPFRPTRDRLTPIVEATPIYWYLGAPGATVRLDERAAAARAAEHDDDEVGHEIAEYVRVRRKGATTTEHVWRGRDSKTGEILWEIRPQRTSGPAIVDTVAP